MKMPRKKELYRENLALLREEFGDVLTAELKPVAKYLGMDYRTLKQMDVFVRDSKRVSLPKVARMLS